jgi:hypothetical protein
MISRHRVHEAVETKNKKQNIKKLQTIFNSKIKIKNIISWLRKNWTSRKGG